MTHEPPPLAPLWNGTLDRAAVEQFFADLAAHAEVLAVLEKGGRAQYCEAARPTLTDAREHLLAGLVRGVQIRYQYEGRLWCDTLLAVAGGYRVVRLRDACAGPGTRA